MSTEAKDTASPQAKKQKTTDIPEFTSWMLDSEDKTPVALEQLKKLGVLHWRLDVGQFEKEGKLDELDEIAKERGYKNRDQIECSHDKMPNLDEKLKIFFEEHLHDDEEIRFVLDGSGYFDVRDFDDKWVRCYVQKGDLLILPAGIWHRFTLDDKMFIKAMRLFLDEPKWTPHNRSVKEVADRDARKAYEKEFLASA
eukprot:TRINITY_DN20078_c0_g1_i1.p1 TRINITY_DN20078_c0_g1~~TRINITY_DN20078_c0_g1_i1.p1  ORF type:complete len:208 (+),score=33.18 TRINITY_DN20078_c0_g1_i1:34-624(+)